MSFVHAFAASLARYKEQPYICRAQLASLKRRLPLLYAVLVSNSVSLALHVEKAPIWLAVLLPGALLPIGLVRIIQWARLNVDALDDRAVAARLRHSITIIALLSMGFTIWSFALIPYVADASERAAVVFFLAFAILGVSYCVVNLRFASFFLMITIVLPASVFLLASGDRLSKIVALDFVTVATVLTINASGYYRAFRQLNQMLREVADLGHENERLASSDSLTGIGNRRAFFQDLEAAAAAGDGPFAVGLIDLDGFKPVNDLHGHAAGDQLLTIVASRLRDALPPKAVCARIGGDEFAFLVPDLGEASCVQALGDRICAAIAAPIVVKAAQVRVEASIGLSLFPNAGRTADLLIEHADVALYHAKAGVRGRAILFSVEHADKKRAERLMKHALRWADLERELSLVFQPIVDVAANRIISFEALARWDSPEVGAVPPTIFVPLAETLGLCERMTPILFGKACAAVMSWPDSVRLSFNLSGRDLAGAGAARRLCRMVETNLLPPSRLTFEVTETAIVADFANASASLQALRDLGCHIALDDFGTGFSSLSYVHRLPLDKLKIDRSFVLSLAKDRASVSIVQSIIDLTAKLGIACVAEGVETPQQVETLRAMGCTVMQGWLFGRPSAEPFAKRAVVDEPILHRIAC